MSFQVLTEASAGQPIAQQPSPQTHWKPSKKSKSVKWHLLWQRLLGKPETLPKVPARFAKRPPGTHVKLVGNEFRVGKNRSKGIPNKPKSPPSPSQVLAAAMNKAKSDDRKNTRFTPVGSR